MSKDSALPIDCYPQSLFLTINLLSQRNIVRFLEVKHTCSTGVEFLHIFDFHQRVFDEAIIDTLRQSNITLELLRLSLSVNTLKIFRLFGLPQPNELPWELLSEGKVKFMKNNKAFELLVKLLIISSSILTLNLFRNFMQFVKTHLFNIFYSFYQPFLYFCLSKEKFTY